MKTKIIYISGNEIFNISDIRDAFDQVRIALNLDKDTVLFGVPVDREDAGFGNPDIEPNQSEIVDSDIITNDIESVVETEDFDKQIIEPVVETVVEPVVEAPVKKRGRPRKIVITPEEIKSEPVVEDSEPVVEESEQKIVPILSILATQDEENHETKSDNIEIIDDSVAETIVTDEIENEPETTNIISEEISENVEPEYLTQEIPETVDEDEADLEKLLSAITPLQEDFMEDKTSEIEPIIESESADNVDATLEQLATEFVASQDKINEETKSNGRSKIGKLRNILPFKQSKNKDSQGLGDLFGWAGIAANDEDFSVPGFFTNAVGKK